MRRQKFQTGESQRKRKRSHGDETSFSSWSLFVGNFRLVSCIIKILMMGCFTFSLFLFQGRFLEEQIVPSSSAVGPGLFPSQPKTTTARTKGMSRKSNRNRDSPDAEHSFTAILSTENTTILAQSPYQTMQTFLEKYPDTVASRFIRHLQAQLHGRPDWEPHRQSVCERTLPLCLGGYHNTLSKTSSISTSPRYSTSLDRIYNFYSTRERDTYLPLLPQDKNSSSVYRLRRYRDTDHIIYNLGTHKACLPLMLAAASIDHDTDMVLELGPFTGFSSKCAAYGILAAKNFGTSSDDLPRLLSFDTFNGEVNYRTISKHAPWAKEVNPNYRNGNASFVGLWQRTVQFVYPQAQAMPGYINATLLNDVLLQKLFDPLSPQVLIADTVKTAKLLHEQLGGLTLNAGMVLFLMDFQRSKEVVQQVYGCFRQDYLLPVYISWNNEHMAFVITKTFKVNDPEIFQCYELLSKTDFEKNPYHKKVMEARVKQDLVFLSGLTIDSDVHERFREGLWDKTMQAMVKIMDDQDEWTWRVLAGIGDRSATIQETKTRQNEPEAQKF